MTQRVILLIGGRSTEHDASLHGYRRVLSEAFGQKSALRLAGVVHVDRTGDIRLIADSPWPVEEHEILAYPKCSFADALSFLREPGAFCFSLLHGTEGEDGCWQGLAEILDLSGSFGGVLPAALAMDKRLQSVVAEALVPGLRFPRTWGVRAADAATSLPRIADELCGSTLIVKPNRMGASLLTRPVTDLAELTAAVSDVFPYDDMALVQEYVTGVELSCGVVDGESGPLALPVVQIDTANDFFGHFEKHQDHATNIRFAADSAEVAFVRRASEQLFRDLDLFAWSRFDYIVSDGSVYFLEVNTMPGVMESSIFPRMLLESGRTLTDLILICIAAAARRTGRNKVLPYEISH